MTEPEPSKASESLQRSLANRETVAPSGLSDSTPTGSSHFAALPVAFGRFQVLKLLGHGAMGTVYLAIDPDVNKEVALKIPKADLAQDAVLWERFQREARAVGDLNHPNICGMYEVGQVGTLHYIEIEYIDGRPLSDFVSDSQSQRRVVSVIRKLALGLAHAHERGIVHRDLKPANVMIDTKGEPKLMDFGLARRLDMPSDVRATQSGMIVGSPAYMSPEQARAEHDKIGPKTDIYGLGVLFFEMLTGSLPFRGQMVVVLGQIATQLPPRPSSIRADVDPQLESLCLKMLAKKQPDRPQSMNDVVQTLTDWLKSDRASANATASDPNMMAIAKEDRLSPVKSVARKVETTDPIKMYQQRVNDLLGKQQYGAAIELLEKIVNLRDARFEKLVAWGRERLPEVRATEQKMQEASAPLCATADRLLKRHDYTEAVNVLSSVPVQYRSADLRDLLERATDLRDECDQLQRDIEDAVRTGDTETLPALVRRLCKLKPHNKAIHQLAADLKQHGAAKVIARRKGQRRFLDPAGRVVEPQHIALGIVLVVGLFVGVSLLVLNYLANSQPPGPMHSPDRLAQPNPPSVPVAVSPQELIPTKVVPPAKEPADVPAFTPAKPSDPLPQTFTSQSTGLKMTLIPAGTFMMGSPSTEPGRSEDEGPQHAVRISLPYYMGVYEVTQGEFEQVMGTNPSAFSKAGEQSSKVSGMNTSKFPVEWVASWYDAIEFCNKLSAKDGFAGYYTLTEPRKERFQHTRVLAAGGKGYRLPTEAEWEYACRANTTTPFHFGNVLNGEQANVNGDFPYGTTITGAFLDRTTRVGSYPANAFGLHDMHGNVMEWCFDDYNESAYQSRSGTTDNPLTKKENDEYSRVFRGGCWHINPRLARAAHRGSAGVLHGQFNLGFRVVRDASETLPTTESVNKN